MAASEGVTKSLEDESVWGRDRCIAVFGHDLKFRFSCEENNNVGPALLGGVALKSIWRNYSGPPDCLRGPL